MGEFLDITQKHSPLKEKLISWISSKFKTVLESPPEEDRRQVSDWKKILANRISDERLVSILYKEISNSSLKGINNSIRKWTKDMTSYYTKANIQRANNHMKRYLTLLAIREMQIQTTKLYHYILIRRAKM